MPTELLVTDNPRASRYELWLGATRAGLIQYLAEPGTVLLVHTEVDPAFAGRGLACDLLHHRHGLAASAVGVVPALNWILAGSTWPG